MRARLLPLLILTTLLAACSAQESPETAQGGEAENETATDAETVDDEGEATDDGGTQEEASIVDDVGRVVDLEVPVDSVAVMNQRNIEFVRAVDAADLVVGVSDSVTNEPNYWPDLSDVSTVGNQGEPNYEAIAELAPDVLIIPRNGAWEEAAERLEEFDVKVVVLTGWDLVQHEHTVSNMGLIFGRRDEAAAVNDFYHGLQDTIEDRLADVDPVPLYLEKAGDFDTAIPGSGWHDMVAQGGGRNIFEDFTEGTETGAGSGSVHTFPVDPESVLEREPEIAVKLTPHAYDPEEAGQHDEIAEEMLTRPGWDTLPLAQDQNVHALSSFIGNASSKIIGSLYIAKWMHPELFDDVNPDEAMTEWVEDFQGVPYPNPEDYRSSL